jgi:hypothetical protein
MKIGICSLTIGEKYKETTKWTTQNKINYCSKHNYTFIDDESIYDASKPIPFSKLLLLKKYLKDFDYLVWIDADILIMNSNITIESFIERYKTYDQITGSDWKMQNTGVWIVKNTDFSYDFLQAVWDNEYDIHGDPQERYMNWEQGSVINLMDRNFLDCKNKIKVTYPEEMNSYWFNYFPGHFVLHFAGVRDELESLILEYYPERLDADTDESYEKRITYLAGPVREYLDRKLQHDKYNERRGVIQSMDKDLKAINIVSVDEFLLIVQKNRHHFDALHQIIKDSFEPLEPNYCYDSLQRKSHDLHKQINLFSIASIKSNANVINVGFNAGHSTLLFLLAHPSSIIHCFDNCSHKYTLPCYQYLATHFPNRVHLYQGNSQHTLPAFKNNNLHLKAQVVLLDGSQDLAIRNGDFFHSLHFVSFKDILIYNGINEPPLKFLWDGYVHDLHLKDSTSHFYPSPAHAIGLYCRF